MWGAQNNDSDQGNPFAAPVSRGNPFSGQPPKAPTTRSNKQLKPPSPSNLRRDESIAYGMTVEELQRNIQHNLTLIQSSISLSDGMINMVGQPNTDSENLRSRTRDVLRGIASKIKKTGDYLKQMEVSDLKKKRRGSVPRAGGIAVRKKLEKDLASLNQNLNQLKNKCELKIRQYPLQPKNEGNPFENNHEVVGFGGGGRGSNNDNHNDRAAASNPSRPAVSGVKGLVGSEGSYVSREEVHARLQQQMLIEGETEVNEVMINERNEAMRKINTDLHEVREIFSDLATMIEDQDEGLEAITTNVQESARAAERGRKELEKANDAQKKSTCLIS